jgi:hypothetical protein
MLSEALTSLEDVKSRLQQDLLQQPEYRALLVVDHAVSQLVAFLGPFDSDSAARLENRAEAPAAAKAAVAEAPEPAPVRARAEDIGPSQESVAQASTDPAAPSPEPSPVVSAVDRPERVMEGPAPTPAIFRMAAVLRELAGLTLEAADAADRNAPAPVPATEAFPEPGEANPGFERSVDCSADAEGSEAAGADEWAISRQTLTPDAASVGWRAEPYESFGGAADPPVSGIGDLYMAIGDGSNDAPSEDRMAQPACRAAAAFEEFADGEAPFAEPAPISGMAAILYETAGDAPDAALADDGGADPLAVTAVAPDAPVRAPSGIEKMIAKATQAVAPGANAPAPRSYLPYIAAQRLVQSRRI